MIVIEDLGLQAARREASGPTKPADDHGAVRRIDPHPGIGIGLEIRLVLDGQHRDRHAFRAEAFDRAREIVGESRIILRARAGPGSGFSSVFIHAGALHGLIITLKLGIDRQRLAHPRQHIFPRGLDREMSKLGIGHVPGRVVIAVVRAREVRRADGQPRERQAEAAVRAAEQLGHDRLALVVGKAAENSSAEASVIAAPKPCIRWKWWAVSIVTASSPVAGPAGASGGCGASF